MKRARYGDIGKDSQDLIKEYLKDLNDIQSTKNKYDCVVKEFKHVMRMLNRAYSNESYGKILALIIFINGMNLIKKIYEQ